MKAPKTVRYKFRYIFFHRSSKKIFKNMFCKNVLQNNISKNKIGCEKSCEKSFLESLAPFILAGGLYFFLKTAHR